MSGGRTTATRPYPTHCVVHCVVPNPTQPYPREAQQAPHQAPGTDVWLLLYAEAIPYRRHFHKESLLKEVTLPAIAITPPASRLWLVAAVSQANICILLGLTWCLDTHTQYNYIQCGYFSTLLRENVRCRTVLTLTNQHPTTNSSWHLCCDIRKHEGGQVTCGLLKSPQKPRLEICWKATESFVDSRNATDKCLDLLLLVLDILKVKDLCKHYILK